MKKNISNLLQKGNLRPKERVLLLVADMASKERDGKSFLTEADKHALSDGWTPKNNEEVWEYNRFNEGWKNVAYAELDAQTTYLQATNSFLRASKYISYIIQKDRYKLKKDDKSLDSLKNTFADRVIKSLIEKGKEGEALNLVLGYLGFELDYTIYLYAFELAGEELQKDLLALHPDAKTECSYLEQEEIIYNLFSGNKELFKKWLDAKAKATETIQGLIDKGELKTTKKTRDFKRLKKGIDEMLATAIDFKGKTGQDRQDTPTTEAKTSITGESLYNLKGDYQFIKDFREQAEGFKIFGALVLFLRECSFVKDYSTLLAFELLFKELSKTFETDLTYSIKEWLGKFRDDLKLFKIEFLMLADDITEASYKADRVYYLTESYLEELLTTPFDPDKVKPDVGGKVSIYASKIKDILQDDFKNPFDYEK